MDLADPGRQQAVAGHRIEHAGLAEQHDQDDRREPQNGAEVDHPAHPAQARNRVDGVPDRVRDIELSVRHDAGEDARHQDIQHGADGERAQDALGHVLLGVFGFLRGRTDRIEADVGEKDQPRPTQHAAEAELAELALVRRNERMPIGRVDVERACDDEQRDDGELQRDDKIVDGRRLLDPDHQHERHDRHDRDGGEIHNRPGRVQARRDAARDRPRHLRRLAPSERRGRQRRGEVDVDVLQQADEVPRPADADGGRPHRILEDEVPADDPRHELAHRGVGVGVRAPGHGDGARHLGVAQARERARDPGGDERERYRGTSVAGRSETGEDEDARTDDGTDAEGGEVQRAQGLLKRPLPRRVGLSAQEGDRLRSP